MWSASLGPNSITQTSPKRARLHRNFPEINRRQGAILSQVSFGEVHEVRLMEFGLYVVKASDERLAWLCRSSDLTDKWRLRLTACLDAI